MWSEFTVYPKKYAHGFCFAVLCCGYTLTDFPISIRLTSLALWQSNDCPSASKATLMNMDKYFMWIHYERLHNHNKAKHNKTVCIFLGIYCTYSCPIFNGCPLEVIYNWCNWCNYLSMLGSKLTHVSKRGRRPTVAMLLNITVRYTASCLVLNMNKIHHPKTHTIPYPGLVVIQCQSSVHWNATVEIIFGSQCASSVLPEVFQWCSDCVPACSIQ